MGHVHVAADDDRLGFVQLAQVGAEIVLPAHAVVDALEPVLGVGGVDADQIEVRVFQRDHAALVAVLLHADVIRDGEGCVLREDRRAGVALLLRVAPVALIAGEAEVELPGLELGLLETEKIRVQGEKNVLKALFLHGPQAVHVPGKISHSLSLRFASRLSS